MNNIEAVDVSKKHRVWLVGLIVSEYFIIICGLNWSEESKVEDASFSFKCGHTVISDYLKVKMKVKQNADLEFNM